MNGRLRALLAARAQAGDLVTYGEAARELGLRPPNTIQQVAAALDALMAEDAAAGAPILAALVVGKRRDGLPAPGFFQAARRHLGYTGPDAGPDARACHDRLLARVRAHWGGGGA
ncbi:MAG: hypothetical protein H6906_02855 [Hyphomicrobiales bacterium]|nr:hypothetical protein [Hyphomicrobiales bacterium]